MKNELQKLRQQIDSIDQQLLQLLEQRAACALQTSLYKEKSELKTDAIYDPWREQQVIERLLRQERKVLSDVAIAHIFQAIIDECRALQRLGLMADK